MIAVTASSYLIIYFDFARNILDDLERCRDGLYNVQPRMRTRRVVIPNLGPSCFSSLLHIPGNTILSADFLSQDIPGETRKRVLV